AYWGCGIAVEASKKVISWGFETLRLKRIECTSFVTNTQSRRVCEKLGLTFEGVRKKGYLNYDGTVHDINCYAITDEEYFQKNNKAHVDLFICLAALGLFPYRRIEK